MNHLNYFRLLSALAFAFAKPVIAQDLPCGTDLVMEQVYKIHPELKFKKNLHGTQGASQKTAAGTVYTIPCVFHILHQGGPENISDNQVRDAVRILNRDYALQNPDTVNIIPAFKHIADSTGIHFELATKDPAGNCTNGIIHYYDTNSDWRMDSTNDPYTHTWDRSRYLNIYVVKTIKVNGNSGIAGYAINPYWASVLGVKNWDVIVMLHNFIGSIGTGSNLCSRGLGHEVGHWLGLSHTWGDNNNVGTSCAGDDHINDTPPTAGFKVCPDPLDPSQYQLCQAGVSENFRNYMDYSYCSNMFTHEQAILMQYVLQDNTLTRKNLWTVNNLTATGVINPSPACVPIADFYADRQQTCVGSPVHFFDASWNGIPTSYNWSFQGGNPSSSNSQSPIVTYTNPGTYSITYSSASAAGSSAPIVKTAYISVTGNTASYQGSWTEGFETDTLPNIDWTLNSSTGSVYWKRSADAAYTGLYSAKIDYKINYRLNVTSMISPSINLSTTASPVLTFKVATADSNTHHVNTLKVYATVDCGETWTNIYSKTGQVLVTSNSTSTNFIPQNQSDWRQETINLSSFASATYAAFKFEYSRDTLGGASNIFIDDINIQSANGISANTEGQMNLVLFPNPTQGKAELQFELDGNGQVSINLVDVLGRVVETPLNTSHTKGSYRYTINNSQGLLKGIYFVCIQAKGVKYTRKLVID